MSEYDDYDSDGTYFKTWGNSYPIFHATYDPFGSIHEDFGSTGIVVGNNNDTKITWSVPFRFPGQYQDPELEGVIFYNWNRYYSPAIGRYNRADPKNKGVSLGNNVYLYAAANPIRYLDPKGLKCTTWTETYADYLVNEKDYFNYWVIVYNSMEAHPEAGICVCTALEYTRYRQTWKYKTTLCFIGQCECPDFTYVNCSSKTYDGTVEDWEAPTGNSTTRPGQIAAGACLCGGMFWVGMDIWAGPLPEGAINKK